jgi:hypothetical protein
MDEVNGHEGPIPNKIFLVAGYITPEKGVSKARGQISFSTFETVEWNDWAAVSYLFKMLNR